MSALNPASTSNRNAMIFLLAVAGLFLLRSLWTYPVDHGDAVQKYFYAAEILRTGDWNILFTNHHTLRWAAMLPQTGLTWLLGTRYEVFYILPLLMFSMYLVLIVFGLRKLLTFYQQLLLGTLLFFEHMSFHTSNQYLITGLGIFCAFAGVLALTQPTKREYAGVVLAAVLFFVAYGAHVTYLSFAGGGFLWLTLFHKKLSKTVVFTFTILLLILIETVTFNYLSEWQLSLGRLQALAAGEHIGRNATYTPIVFSQLFTRWLALPPPHLLLCLGFITSGVWIVLQKKNRRTVAPLIECTFLVGLSFAIGVTFALFSLDPLRPVMPLRPRYLVPFFPFASVMSVYMLSMLATRVFSKTGKSIESVMVISFMLFLLIFPTYKIDFFRSKFDSFLWKADKEYSEYSDKFAGGELILVGKTRRINEMIALFRNPVIVKNRHGGFAVIDVSQDALCVAGLDKSPLYLNYKECPKNR